MDCDGDGDGDGNVDGDGDEYLDSDGFPPGGQSPVSPVQYSGRSQSPVACLQRFLYTSFLIIVCLMIHHSP